MRGRFITVEGIDGAGKSTHLEFIASWLKTRAINPVLTREPGGTPIGEKLRELLLATSSGIAPETETLMMFASRQQLLLEVIQPALRAGRWVISDRFTDATFAYQGGGRGVVEERIRQLEQWVQQDLQPDLTFLFDLPLSMAQRRLAPVEELDRFEQQEAVFHERVRQTYLTRARTQQRCYVIDAARDVVSIQLDIVAALARFVELS